MYRSRMWFAKQYNISYDTVKRREREMRALIVTGEYKKSDFTNDPPRIREEAFHDYLFRRPILYKERRLANA